MNMKMTFRLMKMKLLLMELQLLKFQVVRLSRQVLALGRRRTSSMDVAGSTAADPLSIVGHGAPKLRLAWLINRSELTRQARR